VNRRASIVLLELSDGLELLELSEDSGNSENSENWIVSESEEHF